MSAKNEPNKPSDSNANEVDVPRLVRLEVDLIETRRYTKTIELPEEFANRVIGKLWANDNRGGLSEADCIAACLETPGPISREVIENECDTIDVLDVYEPNKLFKRKLLNKVSLGRNLEARACEVKSIRSSRSVNILERIN